MSGEVLSQTVAEANELRAKLGIPLLRVDDAAAQEGGEVVDPTVQAPGNSNVENDIMVAPVVPGEKAKTDGIKEKLKAKREKREIEAKLKGTKSIGHGTAEDDSAAAWVRKSRMRAKANKAKQAKEAAKAAQAAKYNRMDEEDQEELPSYTSKDLSGLTVRHDSATFQEGSTTILTLADAGVLDEEASDELLNVNMAQVEREVENKERTKGKGFLDDYNGYDDDEFENPGVAAKKKATLAKYDDVDVVDGEKSRKEATKFTLGADGAVDLQKQKEEEEAAVAARLKRKPVTLEQSMKVSGSDYYTAEEMTTFKKKKKRRKVKKGKMLKASDLEAMPEQAEAADSSANRSSRANRGNRGRQARAAAELEEEKGQSKSKSSGSGSRGGGARGADAGSGGGGAMDTGVELGTVDLEANYLDQSEMLDGAGIDDAAEAEAEAELEAAMSRARRIKRKKQVVTGAAAIAAAVQVSAAAAGAEDGGGGNAESGAGGGLVISSTQEFVRNVGTQDDGDGDGDGGAEDAAAPNGGGKAPAAAASAGSTSAAEALPAENGEDDAESAPAPMDTGTADGSSAWTEADANGGGTAEEEEEEEVAGASSLLNDTQMGNGLMDVLQYTKLRGFLDETQAEGAKKKQESKEKKKKEKEKGKSAGRDDRDRDRGDRRGGGYSGGRAYQGGYSSNGGDVFTKAGYAPNIKFEYRDDAGRELKSAKEQFRYLSHKFHGKGSGTSKSEKRLVKLQEQELSKKMDSGDTPLNMALMMRQKMEETGSAHVVISGGGGSSSDHSMKKKKRGSRK